MKAFVISVIIVFCVIAFSIIGASNIVSICDTMSKRAISISYENESDRDEALKYVDEIKEYWEDKEFRVSAFSGHTQTNEIADAIGAMRESIAADDTGSYLIFKSKLIDSIQKVRDTQTISFDSII